MKSNDKEQICHEISNSIEDITDSMMNIHTIQCQNCLRYFDSLNYGINLQNKCEFDQDVDTFSCEECYMNLHFPFHVKKYTLLKAHHIQCNTKYEFLMQIDSSDFNWDDCIVGVFLSKENLINIFNKNTNSSYFINVSVNGNSAIKSNSNEMNSSNTTMNNTVIQEGSNYFIVEAEEIRNVQNTVRFECVSFKYNLNLCEVLLQNDEQRKEQCVDRQSIVVIILHCKKIAVSQYTSKVYKKKFWNTLNQESLFSIFLELEQIHKEKILLSQENNRIELFLKIKNFHQIFPYMYSNEIVMKMNDDAVIQYPAFTYHHHHPFDLRDFCYVNSTNPTWLCPICNKHKIFLKEIQLDFYLFALIQSQYLKDSLLSNKIKQILSNKPTFDYKYFSFISHQFLNLSNKSTNSNIPQSSKLESDQHQSNLSNAQDISNISNQQNVQNQQNNPFSKAIKRQPLLKNALVKSKSSIQQSECVSGDVNDVEQNRIGREYQSQCLMKSRKSKTGEEVDIRQRNDSQRHNLSNSEVINSTAQQDALDKYLSYINPYQLYSRQQNNITQSYNQDVNDIKKSYQDIKKSYYDVKSNQEQQKRRVHGTIINSYKSKTLSKDNSKTTSKENHILANSNRENREEQMEVEEDIQQQRINDTINNNNANMKFITTDSNLELNNINNLNNNNNNVNKNNDSLSINFNMQVQDISDLKEKQSNENQALNLNGLYLESSFLRSPLEIKMLFNSQMNSYQSRIEHKTMKHLLQSNDFEMESTFLQKIFQVELLANQQIIFNLMNSKLIQENQHDKVYERLKNCNSVKILFESLTFLYEQYQNCSNQNSFYELLSSLQSRVADVKEKKKKQNSIELGVLECYSQQESKKKVYIERVIECVYGICLFREQGQQMDIYFEQMLLEYILYTSSNLSHLFIIHHILITYFQHQCQSLLLHIKRSLNYLPTTLP